MLLFISPKSAAQTKLVFKYDYSSPVEVIRASVHLSYSNNRIELLDDTIRRIENRLNVPTEETDYVLSVKFECKAKDSKKSFPNDSLLESLDYPFRLVGSETDVEINVGFFRNDFLKKQNGSIEIIKYYHPGHNLEIKYLPKMKGDECYKPPYFMLRNNSNDTIYGEYHPNYFWGSISFGVDSGWSRDCFGCVDYNFAGGSPLFPDSVTLAWVGSFGWRDELPKNRYKYTLIYTTDKNSRKGLKQHREKDGFIWWTSTKKYHRLVYEFDVR